MKKVNVLGVEFDNLTLIKFIKAASLFACITISGLAVTIKVDF